MDNINTFKPLENKSGVLVTGASGFLGGYLVKELLERSQNYIVCLIRPDEKNTGSVRLMENLYFLFGKDVVETWPLERIIAAEGDLEKEKFGFSEDVYNMLLERIDSVFHAAAMLWHFGKMEQFLRVNVQGTENLLAFCSTGSPKKMNHISTLAVSGRRCDNPENLFSEKDFHENMKCPNVYVETKHEAEKRLRPAMLAGQDVRIFRPGFIMGDSKTGRFKKHITSDAQYLHLQGHIFMRTAPPLYDDDFMDLTPIDYAAAAIVYIALEPDTPAGVYHVCNPEPILKTKIWDVIREYGFPIRIIEPEGYLENVLDADDELFLRGLQSVIVYLGDYEKSPAIFDSSETLKRLEGSGIKCPAPDDALLNRYIDYCVDIGFLPKPSVLNDLTHMNIFPIKDSLVLGIDIGSISLDIVLLDWQKNTIFTRYIRHNGQPDKVLCEQLEELEKKYIISAVAVTGMAAERTRHMLGACIVNEVIAQVVAANYYYPNARAIIDIGGQDSKYIQLESATDKNNSGLQLKDFSVSSMCASGTGSFLDQQATRLGLDIENDFGNVALRSKNPARIAGRCSVFAKSDMIHLQQKGTPIEDIVAGLCHALARSFKANVVGVKTLCLPIALVGGVAANVGVIKALYSEFQLDLEQLFVPNNFALAGAFGAAIFLIDEQDKAVPYKGCAAFSEALKQRIPEKTLVPLKLSSMNNLQGSYKGIHAHNLESKELLKPSEASLQSMSLMGSSESEDKDDSIRSNMCLPLEQRTAVYLGVDIGSISTNIVLLNEKNEMFAKYYLMTASRPIEAVKTGFKDIMQRYGNLVDVQAVGVTGSGRHLIGDLIGADIIVNEITAHATASAFICPEVDTIFEIGGQDSKYIYLDKGLVKDFTMNKACAAGTGSFLEEQSEKLGISIKRDFAKLAISAVNPVNCGEQCTVFIDSEIVRHQQCGTPVNEIAGGLAYSIATNFLHRVVEKRFIGEHILFQGGVAFNVAVLAAFEQLTGKSIIVPPHNEVMGAIGCCLLAKRKKLESQALKTTFTGFDVLEKGYIQESFQCNACANQCDISKILVKKHQPLFYGGRCERYEVRRKVADKKMRDLFAERENLLMTTYQPKENTKPLGIIGYPRALTYYEYFPFFQAFFSELGFVIMSSPATNAQIIHDGVSVVASATCFPTKVAHGHVAWMKNAILEGKADYMLIPSIIETVATSEDHPYANHCSYIQFIPDLVNEALHLESSGIHLLRPALHFRVGKDQVLRELMQTAKSIGIKSKSKIREACDAAYAAQESFRKSRDILGKEILESLKDDDMAIVLVGKAHNIHDPGTNMNLSRILRGMGIQTIPGDILDLFHSPEVGKAWRNLTLAMGQRSIVAADIVRRNPRLNAIYLANFGCVNDSMYPHFFGREMGEKPFLLLEIDEHSAEAGVVTRCEAFIDAVENFTVAHNILPHRVKKIEFDPDSDRVLYLPHAANGMVVWAAALRAYGLNAKTLPPPDKRSLEWGRKCLDGKECLPCTIMTGDMIRLIKDEGIEPSKVAFFMPGSCGSCRYDLFKPLQQIIFEDLGLGEVALVDEYQGANHKLHAIMSNASCGRLTWKGFIALDILEKLRLHIRPYEIEKGDTDKSYFLCLDKLVEVVEVKGNVEKAVINIVKIMNNVSVDRSISRPIIGLVGEAYLRNVDYASNNIVQCIEQMGGEIRMRAIMEVLWYSLYKQRYFEELGRHHFKALVYRMQHGILNRIEKKIRRHAAKSLPTPYEKPIWDVINKSGLNLDAGLGFGASIEMAESGIHGIIHAIPFNCVPGTVIQGLEGRFRSLFPSIPFMTVGFSGQNDLGINIRLEAFVHQCRSLASVSINKSQ